MQKPQLSPAVLQQEIEALKKRGAAGYCAHDPDMTAYATSPMLGEGVLPDIAKGVFEYAAANEAFIEYLEPSGDLYLYLRHEPLTTATIDGILRATQGFMTENAAFVQGRCHQPMTVHHIDAEALDEELPEDLSFGSKYDSLGEIAIERTTTTPTYVITPATIPTGQSDAYPPHRVATPRVIFQVKHRCFLFELDWWATVLLGDPLICAVVGIVVYHRYDDGTFAMLAVIYRRDHVGRAALHDMISFGTRPLHPNEMKIIHAYPLRAQNTLRVLPCPRLVAPHVKHQPPPAEWAGLNPTITVPGRDVFWQAPAPSMDPLPDLVIDLWPILDEVAALYNP